MKKIITCCFVVLTFTGFSQVPFYIPSNGLVGWWPFTGNTMDSSGHGNNGTNYGATLTQDRFGNNNSAYYFDLNSYIECGTSSLLDLTYYTACAWVKTPITAGYKTILAKEGGTPFNRSGYAFDIVNNMLNAGNNGVPISGVTHDSVSTVWNFVACIYDGINYTFYINDTVYSSPYTITPTINSSPLYIGKTDAPWASPPYLYFVGAIDDIGLWNRALSPDEINLVYRGATLPINEYERGKRHYSLYPNPTRNFLQIKLEGNKTCQINIYNSIGKLVQTSTSSADSVILDMTKESNGIYYIAIRDEEGIIGCQPFVVGP